jgi:hypothetical protein
MSAKHVLRIAAVGLAVTVPVVATAGPAGAAPRRPLPQIGCEALGGTYIDDWPGGFGCAWLGGAYIVCLDTGECTTI